MIRRGGDIQDSISRMNEALKKDAHVLKYAHSYPTGVELRHIEGGLIVSAGDAEYRKALTQAHTEQNPELLIPEINLRIHNLNRHLSDAEQRYEHPFRQEGTHPFIANGHTLPQDIVIYLAAIILRLQLCYESKGRLLQKAFGYTDGNVTDCMTTAKMLAKAWENCAPDLSEQERESIESEANDTTL